MNKEEDGSYCKYSFGNIVHDSLRCAHEANNLLFDFDFIFITVLVLPSPLNGVTRENFVYLSIVLTKCSTFVVMCSCTIKKKLQTS